MRHIILSIISFLILQLSYSQINEVGVFIGGSNLIGDIGATTHISPKDPAIGLLYKWNASQRHSWRASLIYADISGNDNQSDDPRRVQRNYQFDSKLLEVSAGIEFTFLDFDLHKEKKIGTPYLYTGISMANYDNYYFVNGKQTNENLSSMAYGIPMALGFKTNFLGHLILGIEVGARYTFSDEIDGSIPSTESLKEQFRFGNINNNDWYVFSGITITYTFGENACYCIN